MLINLPYGKEAYKTINVPDQNLLGILEPPTLTPVADEAEAVRTAMANPIESPRLKELARPGMTVAIAISDGSRPNIEKRTMPYVLQELRSAGIVDRDITVIVGNGSHRPASDEEIRTMLGDEVDRLQVLNHFSDTSPLVHLGKTPDDFDVIINQHYIEADLKIAIGTVLPHPIAGYSGGGKAVAVGLSSAATIAGIHTPASLDHPGTGLAKTDGNPFLKFMYDAAEMLPIDFLINAVMTEDEQLVDVVCGKVKPAHQALIARTASKAYESSFPHPADIAIVAVGFPKDANLYHICAEGICVAAGQAVIQPVVKQGGTIVIVSPMGEGIYNHVMYKELTSGTPAEVAERLRHADIDRPGMHRAYGVASVLIENEVIFADTLLDPEVAKAVHCKPMATVDEALEYCFAKHGRDAEILVLKNAYRLVPVPTAR